EGGFRFEVTGAFYSPYLLGQDTFVKLTFGASKFYALGKNVVIRGDFRYDHGIPLGDSVLLPEVERFSAGGDNTVRGYADERLFTRVVRVGLPPFDNASQIRVLPAGGNIRVLGSLDAQVRIWKILAGAMFTDAGFITNAWPT